MPAWREASNWDDPAHRTFLDWVTERPIQPSGNPLLALTAKDALVYLGRAFGLRTTDVAKALGISRETAAQAVRRARAVIEPAAEPRLPRRCIICDGTRPAGRVRCSSCREESEKKAAAGRAGAAHRWKLARPIQLRPRAAAGAGGRAGGDARA
jgi:hypothetical protein